jgi:peptidoglycan/xylan/chitin deacetylase (PgdA/CDA1 family)
LALGSARAVRPHPSARPVPAVVRVSTARPLVALTFDDGPDPAATRRIVRELAAAGVHATFFMVGSLARRYPGVVREVAAAGDEVGNHGLTHVDLARLAPRAVAQQVARAEALLRALSGQRVPLFRFPYLSSSPAARAVVARQGLTIVGASVDPRDWTNPGVAAIVERATRGVRPGDIILLHDGGGHPQTPLAVPEIVRRLEAEGYRLVTVSQLLEEATPLSHRPGPPAYSPSSTAPTALS